VVADRNERAGSRIRLGRSESDADDEGTTTGGPHAARLAIAALAEAGAIRECEEHGWVQDRADPHARERAFERVPREEPPSDVSPQAAAVAIAEVLDSIGDTCPECPPQ
jgi:hypothetical protein